MKRFWDKVDKSGKCWEWTACKFKSGHGGFRVNGKTVRAHRVAWELTNGPVPDGDGFHGTCVCHSCDNPSCVNPAHLFLGTQGDNMNDKTDKGRARGGAPSGEANPAAKLTEADIKFIRYWLDAGYAQKQIASAFFVTQANISYIKSGETWNG